MFHCLRTVRQPSATHVPEIWGATCALVLAKFSNPTKIDTAGELSDFIIPLGSRFTEITAKVSHAPATRPKYDSHTDSSET